MRKNLYFLVILAGSLLLGGIIGNALQGASGLGWLGHTIQWSFGPQALLSLDVFSLTFGISFTFNIMQIFTVIIGIIIYYKTVNKVTEGQK
ncbi:MAG: DUF4321 domain-containing protein [Ruminococcus sp.]|nr:DUF4321 domain-containing protein [Ruminococcus sp.]